MSTKIMIEYNPYYVRTKISINNREQIKGSEYYEIKPFNASEKAKFDIKYEYDDVHEIKISIINE